MKVLVHGSEFVASSTPGQGGHTSCPCTLQFPCLELLLMTLASLFCHPTSPVLPGKECELPHAPPLHFPRVVRILLMAYLGCTQASRARQ